MAKQKTNLPTDPADVIAYIGKIADLLRGEVVRVLGLREFFEASDTDAAADALSNYEEGFVAGALRGAAIEAIALACSRASDCKDQEKWTIWTAKHLLSNPTNLSAVVGNGGDRKALDAFLYLADEIERDHSFRRLRKYRNYQIAHHLPAKFAKLGGDDRADLRDLWSVVDDVLLLTDNLLAGLGRATVSLNADKTLWHGRNQAYWRRLIEGPPGQTVKGGGPRSPSG